jgi:enoyl-CoA hydratase
MKTIVLSGAGKNALSTALMQRVLAEVREAKDAPLFLMGDGDAFSAGLNLKEIAGFDLAGMKTFLTTLEGLVKALYEHPAPVVAWVNGHAIAGGCVIALCADLRIMTAREGARIGLNEVAIGLRFPPLTFAMLRQRMPDASLARVLLEAELYQANEAKEIGLIDKIGEESDARAMLTKLAAHPHDIYAATKLLLRPRLVISEEEHERFRSDTVPYWTSPERRAAMLRILEKRRS